MSKNTMININLTPIEELENPYWYLPDIGLLILVLVVSFLSVQYYLDMQEAQVEELRELSAQHENNYNQIQGELNQFNDLNQKITKLESKKGSLLRITDSKLIRYLPVILMENLQNLKPKGLWFTKVSFIDTTPIADGQQGDISGEPATVNNGIVNDTKSDIQVLKISVEGSAFNKVIIAEFMTSLKATQNQEFDPGDVRTQLYFDDVSISFAESVTIDREDSAKIDVNDFKLILTFRERLAGEKIGLKVSRFINKLKQSTQVR